MRFLIITDTHGIFRGVYDKNKDKLGKIDQVILLGDHEQVEVRQIVDIFGGLKIMGINGNHDVRNTYDFIHCFDHELVEKTFTYTGLSGSHRYKPTQIFGYNQAEGMEQAKTLPKADVLFAHDGPYNDTKDDAHCGLKGITWYVKKNHPKTLIHGHLHRPNHYEMKSLFGPATDVYCVYQMAIVDFNDDGSVKNLEQLETYL